MNWLAKRMAHESTYFPIFLLVSCLYAILGCFALLWQWLLIIGPMPSR
jgi:hypothetical protein